MNMEQLQNNAEQQGLVKSSLIFGILSVALSGSGVVGLIFALIAGGKVKAAQAAGATGNTLRWAGILKTIGLIVSIVVLVLYVISFIAGVANGIANA